MMHRHRFQKVQQVRINHLTGINDLFFNSGFDLDFEHGNPIFSQDTDLR